MYSTFECHFKPNQKSQSDMTDPVMDDLIQIFQIDVLVSQLNVKTIVLKQ